MLAGLCIQTKIIFVRNYWAVFHSDLTASLPTSSEWEFQLLHDIISIWCFAILNSRHSHRGIVIPLCFNLNFLKDKWCCAYFHISFSICLSLMRCLFRPFAHFFFLIIGLFVLLFSFSIKAYLIYNIILASSILNSDIIFL